MTYLRSFLINKIDLENPGREALLAQLGQRLSEGCLDAGELLAGGAVQEDAARVRRRSARGVS